MKWVYNDKEKRYEAGAYRIYHYRSIRFFIWYKTEIVATAFGLDEAKDLVRYFEEG